MRLLARLREVLSSITPEHIASSMMIHQQFLRKFLAFPAVVVMTVWSLPVAASDQPIQFNRDIRALLFDRCVGCHGPDENHRGADLRLDEEEGAKEWAIVEGDPDASEFIARITSDDPDMRMPPAHTGKSLSEEEISLLKRWIEEGAVWQPHWAFIAPEPQTPPEVEDTSWPRNDIDRFVLSQLEAEGLKPSPQASKEMLIRRVTFDLTGYPPTLEEVEAFLADNSADAYERLVDRLLNSPAYGEQMAVDWLQSARYADSNGYQNDFRREQWPWRDWVIKAFNDNMPFDQFIVEQTAGDLLPNPERSQIVATGFHRNNRTVTEAGSIEEEWLVENNVDRVETTAAVFLGLTMGCCRCHDHKYDPISQKEFYQFYAFFHSIDEKGVYTETRGNVPPLVRLDTEEDIQKLKELDQRIAESEQNIEKALEESVRLFLSSVTGQPALTPTASISLNGNLEMHINNATSNANFVGGEPEFATGLTGQAIVLNGDASKCIELGNDIQPERDSAFTYSMWVRVDERNGALVSRMDDGNAHRGWDAILMGDGRLKIHMIHHWPDNAISFMTNQALPAQVWSHVAISYDGTSKVDAFSVYFNGKKCDLKTEHQSLTKTIVTDQPLRLGRRSNSLPFKGAISQFKWFDRVLTEEEVNRLMPEDVTNGQPDSVASWDDNRKKLLRDFVRERGADVLKEARDLLAKAKEDKTNLEKAIPTVMVLKERETPRETYLLNRGVYDDPKKDEVLLPNVPGILPPLPIEEYGQNRMALAQWLIDEENPLMSRVTVNRIWQRLFGRGIVKSSENFGVQAETPSHPELLDWLAIHFRESGWDLKAFQKMIVMSATYQQTSDVSPEQIQSDLENAKLSRGSRFRLPSESIRDNALAVSGLLTHQVGGPSVFPYQPAGLWEELSGGASEGAYKQSKGADLYRRSLYTNRKRTVPHPTMSTFDAPSFEICTVKRGLTNTPLQSLALLNDVTYVEASRKFAERMIKEGGIESLDRIRYGFRLATSRAPQDKELAALHEALQEYLKIFQADPESAKQVLSHGESEVDSTIPAEELAAYTILGNVIFNLDETITRQ